MGRKTKEVHGSLQMPLLKWPQMAFRANRKVGAHEIGLSAEILHLCRAFEASERGPRRANLDSEALHIEHSPQSTKEQ